MSGIHVVVGEVTQETLDRMNKITDDWMMQAARGECSWVCPDCCQSFPQGMPDECNCGHQSCTDIIQRDKARAAQMKLNQQE